MNQLLGQLHKSNYLPRACEISRPFCLNLKRNHSKQPSLNSFIIELFFIYFSESDHRTLCYTMINHKNIRYIYNLLFRSRFVDRCKIFASLLNCFEFKLVFFFIVVPFKQHVGTKKLYLCHSTIYLYFIFQFPKIIYQPSFTKSIAEKRPVHEMQCVITHFEEDVRLTAKKERFLPQSISQVITPYLKKKVQFFSVYSNAKIQRKPLNVRLRCLYTCNIINDIYRLLRIYGFIIMLICFPQKFF